MIGENAITSDPSTFPADVFWRLSNPWNVFLLLHPPKRILEDDEWTIHICLRIYMGNYTKSSWDIYLFSPICLDSLVNSMDSKLDWSHFSLNFLPRQIWKATTQLLFVVRNACCFFPMWRKSKCVDLFHGDLCMGPHTFQGKGGSFVRTKIPDVWSKASEISAETSTTWLQSGVIHHEYLFVQLAEPHFREVLAVFYENLLSCEICAFTTKNQKQTLAGMAWNLTLLKGVGFGICWYLQLSSWCVLFFRERTELRQNSG